MASEGMPSDETLARRAREGDDDAFAALFERHAPLLRARVSQRLPRRLERKLSIADVVQETRIVAHDHIRDFDCERGTFRSWLLGIAGRKTSEAARRFAGTAKRNAFREITRGNRADTAAFAGRGTTPSQAAIHAELAERARAAREALPDDYREVLVFVHEKGMSLREVAGRLGRSREAVKKLYGRALCRFRVLFGDRENADG